MSASLVRKGLDLFGEDLANQSARKKKTSSATSVSTTNKTGLKKLKQAEQKHKLGSAPELTIKGKKVKSSLKKYNQRKSKDNTEETIKYLQLLSSKKTNPRVAEQVVEYQQRRSARPVPAQQKTKQPKSCFSEEDFARFEREHFVGPRKRPAV